MEQSLLWKVINKFNKLLTYMKLSINYYVYKRPSLQPDLSQFS
jgi:hypothetical protein